MSTRAIKRLQNENKVLNLKLENLKAQQEFQATNSLTGLIQSAQAQSNLTSFNPILQNNLYAPLTINWTMLMYMYKTHGLIQTAIDMPVLDALRGGLDIQSQELDKDDIKALQDDLEEFSVLETIGEAMVWSRLFGGGGIIVNTDQNPETPLNKLKIKKLELYAANRWELMAAWKPGGFNMAADPFSQYAARIEEYFWFYNEKMHNSRIITLSGKAAPYILRWQLNGWGMSEVERMVEDFNMFLKTREVTYELLEEAKIDVYRLKDFNTQLASASGTQLTKARIQLMNELKNFNKAIIMDTVDEFEQKQITFSGLAEVMKQNMIGIASALRMPLTKIFGISASGFNSGEDDIENYNAMVESEVRQKLRKPIRQVLNLICQMKFGFEPDLHFEFKPLRVMSSVDEEVVKTSKHNRYLADFDRMLLNSQEMGDLLEKEKLVPIETEASKGLLEDHPLADHEEEMADKEDKDDGKPDSK